MSDALESLQRIVAANRLKIRTTYDPHRGVELLYLVEVVGSPGDVYAQGFGSTLESAQAECLIDTAKPFVDSLRTS